ncbi:leucine-rich repeat receptor-like serine/threonine-protein kinase BAM1 [Cucumis melo]|uniref:non-specific serine/threonine protein kinase n=1 Tax=Cucumis melo TaxID=3656 RepID=A0A1S3B1W9_CUCME|nr:leucine-rich repeat receptor-like serine/threonine-protein kinase BAM1 [Cucumis melo]
MSVTIQPSNIICKQIWLLLLVFQILHFHFSPSFSAFLPESQALLSLKSSISDDPHSSLSSWNPAAVATHCSWLGVTCDSHRHVVALDLSSLDLTATLSPHIASLRFLTNVSFGLNKFSGGIPPEIASLSSLQLLNLSSNVLNGSIPSEFSRLKNLQVLDVYNNNLTGEFPRVVTEMPNLRYLHLGGNFFTGRIPPEVGRLQFLEFLAIHGNDLEGPIPQTIGNLTKLRELFIGYYNTFVGGIPATIGNLSELVRLDAASCGLSGKIPRELGKLQKLTYLFLQQNALSGPLMELGGLKSIEALDISCNMLVGEIPISFAVFKNLRLLHLFDNKLSGEIPGFMADLPKLEILQLWNNNFTGSIPRNLGKNGMLRTLDLAFNHLTGTIPPEVCHGNKLEVLIAMGNSLSGLIPESLGNCISLKRILLWGNALNGSIPKRLLGLPNITQIDLHDNFLSGELPITNSVSANLLQISLSNNMLSGSLPPTIGSLVAVQKLLLDRNKFSGQIPSSIGRLQQLSRINFSQNKFSGSIVAEISECKHLIFLDLSGNELSGEIPNHITNMKLLNYMNLSRNHLVGPIPASIVNMQSLTSVDFSYNNLSGLVLGTGQFGYFNYTSFLGNPYLCGPYLGPCKDGILASNHQEHMKGSLSTPLRLLLAFGFFFCLVAVTVGLIFKVGWFKRARESRGWRLTAFQRLGFSVDEILECLKKENLIAKGGYGTVYTGVMPSGDQITVKRLPKMSNGCTRDNKFDAEIQALGRIRHRHIVRFLGLCSNHETNLLVFEYMPNGSLYEVLHGKKGGHLLWETRYKIAIGTANGLCYLHHHCSPPIVHRNVNSNNIMLDTNFDAQIANSGLAKFLQDSGASDISATEPEHTYSQNVDEKWDVYSFGVVLLELVSGRNPDVELSNSVDLVQWVRNMTDTKKEEIHKIVDQRLSSVPLEEVIHVLNVAMLCTEEEAPKRPTMREVVRILTEHQQQ